MFFTYKNLIISYLKITFSLIIRFFIFLCNPLSYFLHLHYEKQIFKNFCSSFSNIAR